MAAMILARTLVGEGRDAPPDEERPRRRLLSAGFTRFVRRGETPVDGGRVVVARPGSPARS